MKQFLSLIAACGLASASLGQVHYNKQVADWQQQPAAKGELAYQLYLIGDAGADTGRSGSVLRQLEAQLKKADPEKTGVVFLGDNIYPDGLNKKDNTQRPEDELRLNAQLDAVKDFNGRIVITPGNHDWDDAEALGWKQVKRQEKYVQKYLDKGNVFRPSRGCPGPEVIKLAPEVVLIVIDTQWWLHKHRKPRGEKDGCDVRNVDELMAGLTEAFKKYRNKNVIVAAHHPLYSNGYHGGYFPLKYHLFPIAASSSKALVPLPIIGSIYPFYRKFMGHHQDIPHPIYQDMKNRITKLANEYDNIVYAAGHEHNLQYTQQRAVHHIVSGSGSKVGYVKNNKNLLFGAQEKGFARVSYHKSGEVWLEMMALEEGKLVTRFRQLMYSKKVIGATKPPQVKKRSYKGKYVTMVPDSTYAAGGFKRIFFGDLNRDVWTTPLKVEYLDIHHIGGGLTPVKKGGGMQTLSLRMEDANGKQYSLRGVRKATTYLVGKQLRNTLAQDLVYDGMAGSHPYAALAVPSAADAAGVYHTNPKLVYVPKDSALGDYLEEFGGRFCLFEERPDGDMSGYPTFGNSKDVVGYDDAIENMHKKYTHQVDKEYILNARLFDMIIGDWDRHDDQWRWATFKEGKKTIYRPIPRDRDQVFFQFDGLLYSIANRKWLIRRFQPFRKDIRDMAGQNFNARYFDRSFLSEASRDEWLAAAEKIQKTMTDEVIEASVRSLPEEGFAINGEEILPVYKTRRDRIVEFADRYYDILAKAVNVVGTLKDDYFEVKRLENGDVEVSVYPRKKKGEKKAEERFYHRVITREHTKEIVLYGLDGNDTYHLSGEAKKSILIRVVGGTHKDKIVDESSVCGWRKLTKVYETKGKNDIEVGKESCVRLVDKADAIDYDRREFVNDKLTPLVSIGSNPNDGFFIGPGFKFIKQGFKKSPYKYYHTAMGHYAFGSEGFHLNYETDFVDVLGKLDVGGNIRVTSPLVYQYFGAGNETEAPAGSLSLFDIRMNDYEVRPNLQLESKDWAHRLLFDLSYQYVDFENLQIVDQNGQAVSDQSLRFYGAGLQYRYVNQDNALNPSRGIQFHLGGEYKRHTGDLDLDYTRLTSELRLYLPLMFTRKQTTLGLRSGVATNFGDYAFFQANFLNGFQNFRGVRRNRFAGETAFYQNFDIRSSLLKVPNYIAPFDIGILAHFDLGRVWQPGEQSALWHHSYGGGVFINVLETFALMGTYSISDVDRLLTIGSKFLF